MFKKILSAYQQLGIKGLFNTVINKLLSRKAECYPLCCDLFSKGQGLEIGGLTGRFNKNGILPIYPIIKKLDNCNFSQTTTWEGQITTGKTFLYDKNQKPGTQYVSEASDLSVIPTEKYDFIISSHVIPHLANPIKALKEWVRVLKEGGHMLISIPHKDGTFDHRRPVTTLQHIIDDYKKDTQENDQTHIAEVLKLHDLKKDPAAGNFTNFKKRTENNHKNRCIHHHAFDADLVIKLMTHINGQIHTIECMLPYNIFVVVQKLSKNKECNNDMYLSDKAEFRAKSPFISDKKK
ncbi:MAG: methyltransferase [Gammaproteobacteria bacterium]|nr:MAG: methyltransferase [Gammaproteobacteria bacterium]